MAPALTVFFSIEAIRSLSWRLRIDRSIPIVVETERLANWRNSPLKSRARMHASPEAVATCHDLPLCLEALRKRSCDRVQLISREIKQMHTEWLFVAYLCRCVEDRYKTVVASTSCVRADRAPGEHRESHAQQVYEPAGRSVGRVSPDRRAVTLAERACGEADRLHPPGMP